MTIIDRENSNVEDWVTARTLREAIEQSPCAMIVTDANGTIEYVNPRFEELTGYEWKEVVGQNPRILQSGLTPSETYQSMWTAIASGKEWQGEVRNKKKSGELYWGELTVGPVRDESGAILHYVGLEEDITRRKELEEALQASNGQLTRANQELSQFTAMVTHDLRSPLYTMISALELLAESLKEKDFNGASELLEIASRRAAHMSGLITDLLSYTRVGASGIQRESVDFGDALAIALSNLAAEMGNARINSGELPTIRAHKTLIVQLFQNLVGNGIKFNRNAEPEVSIVATYDGAQWEFSVKDNGVGIDRNQIGSLFVPFKRLRSDFEGTGIGLATCKKIVEHHGGSIWIESEPEQGTTVHFCIPSETEI